MSTSKAKQRAKQLVAELLKVECPSWDPEQVKKLPQTQQVLAAPNEVQQQVVLECLEQILLLLTEEDQTSAEDPWLARHMLEFRRFVLGTVMGLLLERKEALGLAPAILVPYLEWLFKTMQEFSWEFEFFPALIGYLEHAAKKEPLPPAVIAALERWLQWDWFGDTDFQQLLLRIDALCRGTETTRPLHPQDAWAKAALEELEQLSQPTRRTWLELLAHCHTLGSKPSQRWLKRARELAEALGQDELAERLPGWFALVDETRLRLLNSGRTWGVPASQIMASANRQALQGLVWCCSFWADARLARSVAELALCAYKKVPGVGPWLTKVGNVCVQALGAMPGEEGVAQLAVLQGRLKLPSIRKEIGKALQVAAQRLGITPEELEELGVPGFGLQQVGVRRESLGEYTAEIAVQGSKVLLRWQNPRGKLQKSVPTAVRREHAEELKELRQTVKDIQRMLAAQTARLEQLYLRRRRWKLDLWRQRYLDHPLVGTLARRLVWNFESGSERRAGIFDEGRLVDNRGRPLPDLPSDTQVSLWHPLDDPTEEVLAWREWLYQRELQQPFKQAHREIYVLTDAERQTRLYSNRFAAHVLRQHQFNALCAARGWKNQLRLAVDAFCFPPHIELPAWGLRAEYWVDSIGEDPDVDANEAGAFLFLATDQVRFYPLQAPQALSHAFTPGYSFLQSDEVPDPVPLDEVPPLVFSEVMRDVDLFVGVASVGNDPTWADRGPEARFFDYWHSFSFGELSAQARTRKEILERIVPRLKIAPRCRFEERFLVVQGDLRTYRIHLGSGNILMEPNDQYLCIVPRQSVADRTGQQVFLPFEGDQMLSIILSKALLLADDTKITDPTILSQIQPDARC